MKTCRECIHFNACEDWVRSRGAESLGFPWKYSDDTNLCDNYNSQTLPPAYIGMKVWVPYVWMSKEVITDLREGYVSGLQQKANKSWKIRVSRGGSVAEYTVEEFHKCCFLTKEDAEKYIEEKVKKYINGN